MTTTTADRVFTLSDSTEPRIEVLAPDEFVSDEADDLVAALLARDRIESAGEALSLEDSMRQHGVDPAEFGLE